MNYLSARKIFWSRFVERTVVLNVETKRVELCIANSFFRTFFCFRDNSSFRTAFIHYKAFCPTGMHVVMCAPALSRVSTGMHFVMCAPALSGVSSTSTAAKQAEKGAETDKF